MTEITRDTIINDILLAVRAAGATADPKPGWQPAIVVNGTEVNLDVTAKRPSYRWSDSKEVLGWIVTVKPHWRSGANPERFHSSKKFNGSLDFAAIAENIIRQAEFNALYDEGTAAHSRNRDKLEKLGYRSGDMSFGGQIIAMYADEQFEFRRSVSVSNINVMDAISLGREIDQLVQKYMEKRIVK